MLDFLKKKKTKKQSDGPVLSLHVRKHVLRGLPIMLAELLS